MKVSILSGPEARIRWRDYSFLFIAALIVTFVLVALQPVPGYMDADYYYAGGMRLANGQGFTELFLWNYLDHPQGLPHPAYSYWYPLASLIAAGGMIITGKLSFLSARIGFILMATLAPLAVAALAYSITRNRLMALISGCLAIFSGYYLPFVVTTDNYGLYLLVGAIYFLILDRITLRKAAFLGLLAGLLNLARGDGLLWLPLTVFAVTLLAYRQNQNATFRPRLLRSVLNGLLAITGYLIVMGAWFIRSLAVFGSLMPPGSGHLLWMTNYNQIFSFTPEAFTFQSWLASGWQEAVQARFSAVGQNLSTAFFAEGMIVFTPLIILGAWKERHSFRVQLGFFGWLVMLLLQSLVFAFASVRGGFFHAETVFQPLWFALAPWGLNVMIGFASKRYKRAVQVAPLLQLSLIAISIAFSVMLVKIRVVDSGWNEGEYLYQKAERFLAENGAKPEAIVMVRNPPAYFIMTGRPAIVIPYGNIQTLLAVIRKYDVRYIILEHDGVPGGLIGLYQHPENYPQFVPLDSLDGNLILYIKPSS